LTPAILDLEPDQYLTRDAIARFLVLITAHIPCIHTAIEVCACIYLNPEEGASRYLCSDPFSSRLY
jgi:hypothetical protein